ncbi:hypothetical protein Tco_0794309 [Tanacetum coccineum]
MPQDQSIPRRNKVDWHMANDDPILTTMRFIPQHEVVQKYGAILPDYLITPAMKESKAFKTYYAFAIGKATPKPKQPAQGLETLSEIALPKAEQLRIVTKQSLIQTHSSHASGSGANKGTGVTPGVPDVPTYESDDEEISWKTSSDDEDNKGDDDYGNRLESKVMRECCFVVGRDAWLREDVIDEDDFDDDDCVEDMSLAHMLMSVGNSGYEDETHFITKFTCGEWLHGESSYEDDKVDDSRLIVFVLPSRFKAANGILILLKAYGIYVCTSAIHVNKLYMGLNGCYSCKKSTAKICDRIVTLKGVTNIMGGRSNWISDSFCDRSVTYKVNAAEGVNAASEEVSTAELVSTAYVHLHIHYQIHHKFIHQALMCWRSAPLSTLYPPTTSESSLDSSSERSLDSSSPSAGPSPHAVADLPPCKRFKDSYSSKTKDGIDLGVEVATSDIMEDEEEFEAKTSKGGTMEITADPLAVGDISEPTGGDAPDLKGTLYDISHYISEVPLDRITQFETAQKQLEAGQLEASRESCLRRHMALSQEEFCQVRRDRDDTRRRLRRLESLVEGRLGFRRRTMTITRSGMTPKAIEEFVNRGVEKAFPAYEATCAANAFEVKSQRQNSSDGDNGNSGNGNGNGGNGNGRNGNPNVNDTGARPVARECTYQDFMKCQPLNFKGTEGVIGLIRWFEKMETVFHVSNCLEKYQVKYATCTLLNNALTWWNSHKRTIGTDAAFVMSWRELMKLIAEVYCPRNEIQKMESKL